MLKERILPGTLIPESGSLASQSKNRKFVFIREGKKIVSFCCSRTCLDLLMLYRDGRGFF